MSPADHIKMAKVHLHASSCTQHRHWAFCLLQFAANQRRKAFDLLRKVEPIQKHYFER